MRPKGTSEELERRRLRAIKLIHQGERPSVVARVLGVTHPSLCRWRRTIQEGNSLQARPIAGRPRLLSDEQLLHLETLLNQGAVAHGWSSQLWTAVRVAILIERYFGVRYHPEHVRKILKERLNWTSQKPQKHARACNDQEVKRWIAVGVTAFPGAFKP